MVNWLTLTLVLLVTAASSWLMAYGGHLLDIPNARSSHSKPTPSGGGLTIVLVFLLSLLWLEAKDSNLIAALLGGCIILALVGIADDLVNLPRVWRLLCQLVAVLWAVYCLEWVTLWPAENVWWQQIMIIISLLWLINLYNFMDGIDGIAASEAIFVAFGLILLLPAHSSISPVLLLLIAACAGFLLLNWAPARIFMGDSGSCVLGYILGVCILAAIQAQDLSIWPGMILLAVFIVDSTYTLLRRMQKGERWYEPHRSHAYQKAARYLNSHAKVTLVVLGLNSILLLPLAYLAHSLVQWGVLFTLLAYAPLVILVYRLRAGDY